MGKLLTHDKKHIDILTAVKVDKTLPKYRRILENEKKDTSNNVYLPNENTFFSNNLKTTNNNSALSYENLKEVINRNVDVGDFNIEITSSLNDVLKQTSMEGISLSSTNNWGFSDGKEKIGFWKKMVNLFKKTKEERDEEKAQKKFDVIKFFSDVHNIISSEETNRYINRISEYVEYIGYTETTGQTALKEKLIRNLVINKLESVLYAKGLYKAINESAIVTLAQKAPKPLTLDYIQNYVKNIPINVIKQKIEADKLEVFDNYAILHYDPDNDSTEMTNEERAEEIRKKRDPILFGLIKGSKKLYFIADWIDETAEYDIDFDKMVEIVGKDIIEKGFLTEKIGD